MTSPKIEEASGVIKSIFLDDDPYAFISCMNSMIILNILLSFESFSLKTY